MKHKYLGQKEYSLLLRKLFLQFLLIFVIAAITVICLRSALRGRIAEFLTDWIGRMMALSEAGALEVYQFYIRNNLEYIMMAGIILLFFVMLWVPLSAFTRYFDQIMDGVNKLAQDSEEPFNMSPELSYIESNLNSVRDRLKQRAEAVRRAEQRKNELVVYLAHDVKTPLTSVLGYLSLLDESKDMPAAQREKYVHIALEKAERLETLVNEFFEITRSNLQDQPLRMEKTNLCYMIVQVADELYPRYTERGQNIDIRIPEEISLVGDTEKLARVFNNLLKNAIAYGDGDSTIRIAAEEQPSLLRLTVQNKGEIPPEELGRIFEKFYRLDSARGSATGGSGLGLAIAKDIAESHGGSIRADSGGGVTVFTVELPKHKS